MADEEGENGHKGGESGHERGDGDAASPWTTDRDSSAWQPSNRPIAATDDTDRPDDTAQTRIAIDLSRDDDQTTAETTDDEYAPEPSSAPIEPETPTLEGAVFVLLGAIVMVAIMIRVAGIMF